MPSVLNVGLRVHGAADREALIEFNKNGQDTHYTYADIEKIANRYAVKLQQLGLVKGDAVGILAENSAAFLCLWLGVLRAGGIVVPVNYKQPPEVVAHILKDANIRFVFCDGELRGKIPAGVQTFSLSEIVLVDGRSSLVPVHPDDVALILYTSGSTGVPKGVPITHGGFNWILDSRLRGSFASDERMLIAAPMYHINALGSATFALAAGISAVLMPSFDARGYIEAIGRFRCTWLTGVPSMMAFVVREAAAMPAADFSSIRQVRMGSSAIGERLLEQVKALFPNAGLQNSYGTTEAGPIVFGPRDGKQPPLGAAGWPMPDVEVRLVDETGNDAERGVLLMRSPVNMKGYLNLPNETKAVLSPDGWYRTGDVFRRDEEGAYWFVSRNDDMFNCGGENIYPQQVERILESHPSVVEVCVVPVPDDLKGAKPFAFVVRRPGHAVTEAELKAYTLTYGPAYQHPRWICFVENLPLASTNKVDRQALKKRALEIAANAGGDETRILKAGNS